MCKRINKADMKDKELMECAEAYSENYVPMFRKAVKAAFMAGMVFDNMLKEGDVTKEMICPTFFRIIDDAIYKRYEEDKA
jgi:hypothetical protein